MGGTRHLQQYAHTCHVIYTRHNTNSQPTQQHRMRYLDDVANLSVRDGDLDPGKVGVEPSLQSGHELHVGDAAGVDGLDCLGHVRGDRLLAEDVLAVLGARLDLLLLVLMLL